MVCVPWASDETCSPARPEESSGLVPSVVFVVVSTKVTDPAGVSVLGALAVTWAWKNTGSPKTVGLLLVWRVIDTVPWLTAWLVVPELLRKLGLALLALKVAWMVWLPTVRVLTVRLALPVGSRFCEPRVVPVVVSTNVTAPWG